MDSVKSSNELFERAKKVAPGGVHSPVRSFKGMDRSPIFFSKSEGPYLWSVEGTKYIDFCQIFGPLILGHRDPDVAAKVKEQINSAWTFGACEPYSLEFAEWITKKIPNVEKLRFVSSGTEAVMSAIRIARAYTKRDKILKFEGCYHGLQQAAAEMLNWNGSGMGVMEMSHRGKEFMSIAAQAEADLRELLAVPTHFRILFMQAGGLAENAIVPMNLSRGGADDFVVTGGWSQKSAKEARKYAIANVVASNEADGHTTLPAPAGWKISPGAQYVHICSNETIHGVEFHELPDLKALGSNAPLVIDFSSHVAARPVDWTRVGLAIGGAQKNLGPAGVTLVVVREDLLGQALSICPSAFDYRVVADNASMYNTPPTYSIYMAGLVSPVAQAPEGR